MLLFLLLLLENKLSTNLVLLVLKPFVLFPDKLMFQILVKLWVLSHLLQFFQMLKCGLLKLLLNLLSVLVLLSVLLPFVKLLMLMVHKLLLFLLVKLKTLKLLLLGVLIKLLLISSLMFLELLLGLLLPLT